MAVSVDAAKLPYDKLLVSEATEQLLPTGSIKEAGRKAGSGPQRPIRRCTLRKNSNRGTCHGRSYASGSGGGNGKGRGRGRYNVNSTSNGFGVVNVISSGTVAGSGTAAAAIIATADATASGIGTGTRIGTGAGIGICTGTSYGRDAIVCKEARSTDSLKLVQETTKCTSMLQHLSLVVRAALMVKEVISRWACVVEQVQTAGQGPAWLWFGMEAKGQHTDR